MELEEYNISPQVLAFSTKRQGGYSVGTYSSFNVNSYCGDDMRNVQRNKDLLCSYLGISTEHLIIPHQTHGTKTLKIDDQFLSSESDLRTSKLEGVDALITDISGCCISVSTADCIPILIYDSDYHAIASIHAGWRGTLSSICQQTLKEMSKHYGTIPASCRAVIGPGISIKNFEVGDEVYDQFFAKGFPMKAISKRYKKWHIDLFECNRLQLLNIGLSDSHVHVCGICTFDNYDNFFSARRLGINSGRILSGIIMK